MSAISSCILGLLDNPAVVKKAQEELDRVIGPNQLPTFEDEGSLPYITAIVKETFRWRDVTPIGTDGDIFSPVPSVDQYFEQLYHTFSMSTMNIWGTYCPRTHLSFQMLGEYMIGKNRPLTPSSVGLCSTTRKSIPNHLNSIQTDL